MPTRTASDLDLPTLGSFAVRTGVIKDFTDHDLARPPGRISGELGISMDYGTLVSSRVSPRSIHVAAISLPTIADSRTYFGQADLLVWS